MSLAVRPHGGFSPVKILILKPSSLGDVVHALPVLRLLKLQHPHAEVFWWLNSDLQPLLAGDPDLQGIFPFHRHFWKTTGGWCDWLRKIRRMRAHRFDWVIDLQGLARSAIHAWLANGAFTIGLDSGREGAAALYDVAVPRPAPDAHAVDWYLAVLPRLGVSTSREFTWLPPRPGVANPTTAFPAARWVTLVPGARWSNKRWPAEAFASVVRQLTQQFPAVRFAIIGGPGDRPAGDIIHAANPDACVNLTGKTSLPEMVEWVRHSELCITNDTGPMHLAAALRRPTVALFGPTNPARTGPYQQLENVLRVPLPCSPCLKSTCSHHPALECLHAITPQAVIARAAAVLRRDK